MLRSPLCRIIIGVVLFFALPAIYSASQPRHTQSLSSQQSQAAVVVQSNDQETFIVTRVVDGDTLVLSNGLKVRLTGIDTPESKSNAKAVRDSQRSGEDVKVITHKGKEAAGFVRKMIEGKEVRLEYDVQKRDRYGRELAYVYDVATLKVHPEFKTNKGVAVKGNEIFLNGSIIRSGYAMPMTVPPNVRYSNLFKEFYQEARADKRGLWADSRE